MVFVACAVNALMSTLYSCYLWPVGGFFWVLVMPYSKGAHCISVYGRSMPTLISW